MKLQGFTIEQMTRSIQTDFLKQKNDIIERALAKATRELEPEELRDITLSMFINGDGVETYLVDGEAFIRFYPTETSMDGSILTTSQKYRILVDL